MNSADKQRSNALTHLAQDPVLARVISETPAPQVAYAHGNDLYLALLESIISQQISTKAADAIFARLRGLFPDNYPAPDALLALPDETLRSAGLSGQKMSYIRNVAEFAQQNRLDQAYFATLPDEEIIDYLTPIRGVGRWTVEMLLMFVLDRPDIFPVDDLVIRQKMLRAYPAETAGLTGRALIRRLHELAEPWRPYRTLASRYLWKWQPAAAAPVQ